MQEIEYEDGEKTKEKFKTFAEALIDAEKKEKKRPIKSLKVTRIIPGRKRRGGCPPDFIPGKED